MPSTPRRQLNEWLKTIEVPDGALVLDVGGAQKPMTADRVKSWGATEHKILDLEEPHEGGKVDIPFDLNGPTPYFHHDLIHHFDTAFCIEISEYLYSPATSFSKIAQFLKKGAILYASFHFFYPHHPPKGKDYLRYTRWGAEKVLEACGFEILEVTSRTLEQSNLVPVFEAEGMHWNRSGVDPDEIGCMIKARKK